MEAVQKCFISLILTYKIRKKTSLLHCTANHVVTGHNIHFQLKCAGRVKLAATNNQNVCDRDEVSLILTFKVMNRQLFSVVQVTKLAFAIRSNFSSISRKGQNGSNQQQKWLWDGWGVMNTGHKCFISLILTYKFRKMTALLCFTTNQVHTCHKLHFQPKNPAWVKLAAINNKNGCYTAEVWWRQFRNVSYHLY